MIKRFSFDQFVQRTGGWSLIIIIALAQFLSLLGALPGLLSIRFNAEFEEGPLETFSRMLPVLLLMTNLGLLAVTWWLTPTARKRLSDYAAGQSKAKSDEEFLAWREITSLNWRHAIAAIVLTSILIILPGLFMSFAEEESISSVFQPTALNASDPIYVLIGGTVALLGSVILAILIIERFTLPIRLILLPKDLETQLKGRSGLLLRTKFLAVGSAASPRTWPKIAVDGAAPSTAAPPAILAMRSVNASASG